MAVAYRQERLDRGIKARSDDIFALASYRELFYLLGPRVLLIGGLLVVPLLGDLIGAYWLSVMFTTCAIALMAFMNNAGRLVGPTVAGYARDVTGSFTTATLAAAVALLIAAALTGRQSA